MYTVQYILKSGKLLYVFMKIEYMKIEKRVDKLHYIIIKALKYKGYNMYASIFLF